MAHREALCREVILRIQRATGSADTDAGSRLHTITRVGVGGADSGIPFHAHETALNVVFGGRKLWLVAQPDDQISTLDSSAIVGSERLRWQELDEPTRLNWVALGWTRASWEGEEPPPASDDLDWGELPSEQALAARTLGFTELTWDEESREDTEIGSPAADLLPSEEDRIREFLEGVNEVEGGDRVSGSGDRDGADTQRETDSDRERVLDDWRRRESLGQAWRCTQQPGDVVFVPEGFLHTTINVEESFSVAVQQQRNP